MPDELNHSKLLQVAQQHDANIFGRNVKINKAIQAAGQQEVTMPAESQPMVTIIMPDDDPFQGNLNNRRVAARIARATHRKFLNNSEPTHVGDPEKARKDVEQSLRVNPDSEILSQDEKVMNEVPKLTPTPGSPAAQKQGQKQEQIASWKP